jgi:Domain of unknown function (DUF927)
VPPTKGNNQKREFAVLEHARLFLERVLPPSIGEGAYLNIHTAAPGQDGRKFWDGRACTSIDDALKNIEWFNSHSGKDIYVCMSLQSKYEQKTSAKGHQYRKALRLAEDVVAIRSLYIDIDVKPEAYPDTASALAALKAFIDAVGLPMPSAVVASGSGGFHVHWALDRALSRNDWQDLANSLANATVAHGLITDTQCTVDSARILRIPGTKNHKTPVPREVTLMALGQEVSLEAMQQALQPYFKPVAHKAPKLPDNDELGAGLTEKKIEVRIEEVAKHCGFVSRSIGTGGRDNSQPLWFLTASLASFVEDGRDAFHLMSNQHPTYTPQETDKLYDRVSEERKKRDIGWPTCQKIASYGCKECQTCPLLAHQKSPMHYALPAQVAAATDLTLPDKFVRQADGTIAARGVNEDGTPLLLRLCHYPILSGWLSNSPWTLHFTTRNENGKRAVVEVPAEVIFAKDGFGKYLGGKGLFCTDQQYKLLKEFFVAWLQKLQTQKESVISASPFGWSVVDGKVEGFAYGGRVWMKDGDRPAANPNPVLIYQYTPKGEIKHWQELAKIIYSQNRPALDAILAVAFAAPLVRFTGFPGLILNAYSAESGIGKTTAMKVSQSVWGHPVLAMQGLNDTSNSVLGKMGQIRSLPMYWDEIKSEAQVKRFCSIVFDLTGGREKTRMNADATLKLSGTWQTMMVSASNDSLVDGMAREVGSTTAGLHRLFEYVVPKPAEVSHDIGAVQRLAGRLEDNYGHAGMIYSKFLGTNWSRVEAEVAARQDELNAEVRTKQEERMWVSTMAVILKGAEYANELGLMEINLDNLRGFLMNVLDRMRAEVNDSPSDMTNDMSVSSVLADFLNSTRSRNTLVTNRIWVSAGKPPKGYIQIITDTTRIGDLMVQIGREDGIIRISSVGLSRWMAERGYSRQAFVKKLEEEFGLRKVNGKLGGGTEMASAVEHLIELDMNHQKLSRFLLD